MTLDVPVLTVGAKTQSLCRDIFPPDVVKKAIDEFKTRSQAHLVYRHRVPGMASNYHQAVAVVERLVIVQDQVRAQLKFNNHAALKLLESGDYHCFAIGSGKVNLSKTVTSFSFIGIGMRVATKNDSSAPDALLLTE